MKDQLITFETAKLAKEKGFDIPVRYGVYGKKMKLTQNFGWERNEKLELTNWNSKNKQQKNSKATSVPTQSLLQKWLREKHNTNIDVNPKIFNTTLYFHCTIPSLGFEYDNGIYEIALEKGLQTALKLIQDGEQ